MDIVNKLNDELLKQTFTEEQQLSNRLNECKQIASHIRMRDNDDKYVRVLHRMFYIASQSNGSIWLSLCLYNLTAAPSPDSAIINSSNGQTIELQKHIDNDILSVREKEILQFIEQGMMSKVIASTLSISINTVNRHRQNILEKLHVSNSIEACRLARGLKLI